MKKDVLFGMLLLQFECLHLLKGRGTVATGRVEQGTIKVGEEVEILGLSKVKVHLTFFFYCL